MSTPAVSVVICTHSRLALLQAAVESCLRDATRRGLDFEIVVSDNSPGGHARAYVEGLAETSVPVRWAPSRPSNISVARNAGIRAARAEIVAFLDDDLQVGVGWLDHLLDALRDGDFDAVMGPVRPSFEDGRPPAWDPTGSRYTRVLDAPSGTQVVVAGPDRTRALTVSTASSAWRAATCFTDEEPFSPAFGTCGGEDFELMWRLERQGRRFGWSADAAVTETIPHSRTEVRYQALRSFTGGQVYTNLVRRHSDRPLVGVVDQMVRGAVQLVLALALMVPGLAVAAGSLGRRPALLVDNLLLAAAAAGKLTWFRTTPLYSVEEGQRRSP